MMTKAFTAFIAAGVTAASAQVELATNGGFETGDTSGWADFTSTGGDPAFPNGSFTVTGDANTGSFAGRVFNDVLATPAVVKQANLGVGVVEAGGEVTISFAAKGNFAEGGVAFAEFFTEIDGGGTSSSQILGGEPLFFETATEYQNFSFTVVLGNVDLSGGITFQLAAVTGGAAGSSSELFIDDVSVSYIPAAPVAALAGLGGVVAARRRR